ncbi:UPF0149 family protein [Legionella israelensis]|uniref:UPF0149 family protein n=1 Tax=Legionella israelensis TaxID=454 RepID=UPI00117E4C79|nr:YecA family protein [Legionella israelensis]QDP71535.1 UPF0149 family protein [Legionella israelensis]
MSLENKPLYLPSYQTFVDSTLVLNLPFSVSELHGMMCSYLCVGAATEGENYLRALMGNLNSESVRKAALAMFQVYAISQQQMNNGLNFEFQMLLPEDHIPLRDRAQAFSEWCEGFTQGLRINGIHVNQLQEEDAQDAMRHLAEFAELDYESLDISEEDEMALLEVSEYARIAVLSLHGELTLKTSDHHSHRTH